MFVDVFVVVTVLAWAWSFSWHLRHDIVGADKRLLLRRSPTAVRDPRWRRLVWRGYAVPAQEATITWAALMLVLVVIALVAEGVSAILGHRLF